MLGELANNEIGACNNNQNAAQSFALPDDIDDLIDASDTYLPEDVWMEYVATLPLNTPTTELHRIKPMFISAVASYMGVDE